MSLVLVESTTEEKITLEQLEEDLIGEIWQLGKSTFKITEEFLGTKKRALELDSLCLILEDEFAMFSDFNDLIFDNQFASMMFVTSTVKNIIKQKVNGQAIYTIVFKNGTIIIE
jgi:hypothetical protein